MTALWIIAILILLILLLLLVRVQVLAEYGAEGALAVARAGPFRITLYPREKIRKGEPKPEKKDKQAEGGPVSTLRELLQQVIKTAARLHKKLVIDYLQIDYLSAAEDPARAALGFGLASAGIGVLTPMLENHFIIKERKLRSGVSYTLRKPVVYAKAIFSLRVGQILSIAFKFVFDYQKGRSRKTKQEYRL